MVEGTIAIGEPLFTIIPSLVKVIPVNSKLLCIDNSPLVSIVN